MLRLAKLFQTLNTNIVCKICQIIVVLLNIKFCFLMRRVEKFNTLVYVNSLKYRVQKDFLSKLRFKDYILAVMESIYQYLHCKIQYQNTKRID